jgi:hypothetical protein
VNPFRDRGFFTFGIIPKRDHWKQVYRILLFPTLSLLFFSAVFASLRFNDRFPVVQEQQPVSFSSSRSMSFFSLSTNNLASPRKIVERSTPFGAYLGYRAWHFRTMTQNIPAATIEWQYCCWQYKLEMRKAPNALMSLKEVA